MKRRLEGEVYENTESHFKYVKSVESAPLEITISGSKNKLQDKLYEKSTGEVKLSDELESRLSEYTKSIKKISEIITGMEIDAVFEKKVKEIGGDIDRICNFTYKESSETLTSYCLVVEEKLRSLFSKLLYEKIRQKYEILTQQFSLVTVNDNDGDIKNGIFKLKTHYNQFCDSWAVSENLDIVKMEKESNELLKEMGTIINTLRSHQSNESNEMMSPINTLFGNAFFNPVADLNLSSKQIISYSKLQKNFLTLSNNVNDYHPKHEMGQEDILILLSKLNEFENKYLINYLEDEYLPDQAVSEYEELEKDFEAIVEVDKNGDGLEESHSSESFAWPKI